MADTKRQKIIDEVIARMQTILVTNGYQSDLGLHVGDCETNWDESELPALSVFDLVAEEDGDENGDPEATNAKTTHSLPVQFRIFVKSDTRTSDLRKMIADVKKAIGTDPRWKVANVGLALRTIPQKSGLVFTENFEVAGAAVEVEIWYRTKVFNEYE